MTGRHGAIALDPDACTSCNLCVVECPTWCIDLTAHSEQVVAGRRGKTVKVLDDFTIDFGLCMFCGICVDVCPFDALLWVPEDPEPANGAAVLVEGIAELAARWPAKSGAD